MFFNGCQPRQLLMIMDKKKRLKQYTTDQNTEPMHTQVNTCMTHLHTDTPLHFQPKKDGLSSTDCESLAAAITSTQCAENVPAKSAFPVTHTMGRASRKRPLILLSRQQPPEEEEEEKEDPECVQEDFQFVVQFVGYVPVTRNLILFHQKAPSNQVMEVLVHPSYLGLFPQSITLV